MRFSSSHRFGAVFAAILLTTACGDTGPTEITGAPQAISSGPVLVECPTAETRSVSGTLDLLGGTIRLDGHSLTLPVGALLLPTEFTLTVPASRFVEVHVTANGQHGFEFLETAAITISYERCTRNNIAGGGLTAYKIDPATKALLKHMGGIDDTLLRRVTFSTDSLSGYAIAQ
ncbi:MAG: hypothetical protein ACREK1_01100 [Longimicrobiales bacterium]